LKTYYALNSGWVNGQRVTRGQAIELSEAQAKYESVSQSPLQSEKPAAKAEAAK
jgi:hypothetical protein